MPFTQPKSFQSFSRVAMVVFYLVAGSNHFIMPALYLRIMPPYLPYPLILVYLSGLAEVVLGALLLSRGYSRWAAWGIIGLLLAVFPANIEMLLHCERFPAIPVWILWMRLPLQALFIYWAYRFTQTPKQSPELN